MDNSWVHQLQNIPLNKNKGYSQFGEEDKWEFIFKNIGNENKFLVDFGAGGLGSKMSNSKYFMENGWTGLRMDGAPDPDTDIKKEFITAENICELFRKYDVPKTFDYLSIDVDGNDYWILQTILANGYVPRLVIAEFNGTIQKGVSKAIKYNPNHSWGEDDYYGFSFDAGKKMMKRYGYSLVHQVATTNMYFVLDELVCGHNDFGVTYIPTQYHKHSPNKAWELV